jgi:hypothetical protein
MIMKMVISLRIKILSLRMLLGADLNLVSDQPPLNSSKKDKYQEASLVTMKKILLLMQQTINESSMTSSKRGARALTLEGSSQQITKDVLIGSPRRLVFNSIDSPSTSKI